MEQKTKITKKLKKLSEAKIVINPNDYEKVADKLKDSDIVKFVDEQPIDEVNKDVLDKFIQQYGEKRGKQIYYATANKQNRDPETFHMESEDDEDYERASREVEYGINPETGADWDELLSQASDIELPKGDMNEEEINDEENDESSDKLKSDVQKFINRLNLGQFKNTLVKINTPIEQAEVIAAFAEVIGVPRAKLPMIIKVLKQQAESIRPRMKKNDLIETVLKIKKQKKWVD